MSSAFATPVRGRIRIAVVGSGPSGLYTVKALAGSGAQIDVIERLPSPFGLVRGGVAPDHTSIRRVTTVLGRLARGPDVRLLGNVEVGRDVSLADLRRAYHAVVVATGAPLPRRLGVPGEDLPGVWSSTDIVGWYNAHPDQAGMDLDLGGVRRLVVLGQGNVAVDVARVFCRPTADLRATDIGARALAALEASSIEEILLVGRRGPAQAAFSARELRILADVPGIDVICDPPALDAQTEAWLATAPRDARDTVALVRELAGRPRAAPRAIRLVFQASPAAFLGDGHLRTVRLAHTTLRWRDGVARAEPDGATSDVDASLAVVAIGNAPRPLPGLPMDRDHARHAAGRVLDDAGAPIPGLYAAGWIKRGPTGLVGDNVPDAAETAASVVADLDRLPTPTAEPEAVLAGARVVDWDAWARLDAEEIRRGALAGKPRERFETVDEMLTFLDARTAAAIS